MLPFLFQTGTLLVTVKSSMKACRVFVQFFRIVEDKGITVEHFMTNHNVTDSTDLLNIYILFSRKASSPSFHSLVISVEKVFSANSLYICTFYALAHECLVHDLHTRLLKETKTLNSLP